MAVDEPELEGAMTEEAGSAVAVLARSRPQAKAKGTMLTFYFIHFGDIFRLSLLCNMTYLGHLVTSTIGQDLALTFQG